MVNYQKLWPKLPTVTPENADNKNYRNLYIKNIQPSVGN